MKKKLLAIILCAVLLTGVCATSFAANIENVLQPLLSDDENTNDEAALGRIKDLSQEAIEMLKYLSPVTFGKVQSDYYYILLQDTHDELLSFNDDDDFSVWKETATQFSQYLDSLAKRTKDFVLSKIKKMKISLPSPAYTRDMNICEQIRSEKAAKIRQIINEQ